MVDGVAKLTIDLGNSQTRVTTQYVVNAKGKPRKKTSVLDNRYCTMPEEKVQVYLNSQIYTEEDSCIFKGKNNEGKDVVYCNGEISNAEFDSLSMRPTALCKKYSSLASKLAIINGFRRGYEDVAEFTDSDLESINVTWDLVLLLPPEDIDAGAKLLAELARSITEIDFIMPKLTREITINGIKVYPEGYCAYIGVLLESKSKVRSGYAYLADPETYTLIIDIGAGTTDFVLAKGQSIVTSSRFTRTIGGNNVHQRVRTMLKAKNINLPDSAIRKGCEVGKIKSGSKVYDIREEISAAKADVSRQLVDAVQQFFEENMMSVDMISNILVCGGGAEGSDGIEPTANYIVSFMKEISPNTELVELPEIDGQKVSPRLLNIIGASILAE